MSERQQDAEEECVSLDELYGEPWMSDRHIDFLFAEARGRTTDLINSRFRGAAIATGWRCAKARRLLGVHPTQKYCACGMPWESDMDQFGCWSCGAAAPV